MGHKKGNCETVMKTDAEEAMVDPVVQKSSSKWQLATLVIVAALALTSIVLFAEQLVVRHLSSSGTSEDPTIREEVSVMQLEDWAGHRETIRFGNGDIVSIRAIQNMVMPPPPRVPDVKVPKPTSDHIPSKELPVPTTATPPGESHLILADIIQSVERNLMVLS